jgi:hypothetical protein
VARDNYPSPGAVSQSDGPNPKKRGRIVLLTVFGTIVLPLALLLAWQVWRDRSLLAFCKASQPGIMFSELLALEKRHSIDDSYLVQAKFDGYIDQVSSPGLEFRSQIYDPDFACAIGHDGQKVLNVQLLTLEGFDPN